MDDNTGSEARAPMDPSGESHGPWKPSISLTLTFGFGLLVFVAVGLVTWILLDAARQNTFDLLRRSAELTVDSIAARIDQHLGAAARQAEYLAEQVADGQVEPEDPERLAEIMFGALAATPQVSVLAFVRSDLDALRVGRVKGMLVRTRSDFSDRSGVRDLIERARAARQPSWMGVVWAKTLKAPHVAVAVPVYRNDVYLGSFFSLVSIQALSRFLSDIDVEFGTHSYILYGRDRVLAHPSLAGGTRGLSQGKILNSLGEINDPVLTDIWSSSRQPLDIFKGEDGAIKGYWVEGRADQQLYIYREVVRYGPEPWFIGIHHLGAEVGGEIRRLTDAGAVAVAVLAVSLVLVFVLGRAIARPLNRLAAGSRAIRSLDLSGARPLDHSLFREIDFASTAYNSMLGGLRWFETYVPKSLVLRLMQLGETAVGSEHRTVTVMFTDIRNFSTLSEDYTATELLELLNRHFSILIEQIESQDGTVDKYIGDSVMAFWGAPEAQPDHAAAACRAALAIRAALAADNAARRAQGLDPLGVRIGVHSGDAVVGNIGGAGRVNYTLIGDTVNVAQRLESLGKELPIRETETTVLISGETAALLDDGFQLQPLGEHRLRGRRGMTAVLELLGDAPS